MTQPHRVPRDELIDFTKPHGVTRDRSKRHAHDVEAKLAAEIAAKASSASDESAKRIANAERASGRARVGQ